MSSAYMHGPCTATCGRDEPENEYDEYMLEDDNVDNRWTEEQAAKFDEIDEAMDEFWDMFGGDKIVWEK